MPRLSVEYCRKRTKQGSLLSNAVTGNCDTEVEEALKLAKSQHKMELAKREEIP